MGKYRNRKTAERKSLKVETRKAIAGIALAVCGAIFLLAGVGLAGIAGEHLYGSTSYLIGSGYFLLPLGAFLGAFFLMRGREHSVTLRHIFGFGVFTLAFLGLCAGFISGIGGIAGNAVYAALKGILDTYAAWAVLLGTMLVALMATFDAPLNAELSFSRLRSLLHRTPKEEEGTPIPIRTMDDRKEEEANERGPDAAETVDPEEEEKEAAATQKERKTPYLKEDAGEELPMAAITYTDYTPPPLSLLERDRGKPSIGDTKANANVLKRTLQNFGIQVEIDEINVGPTVTRYALKPAEGVRLSKIISLQSNLELALAASPLRIEAPIPGKSLVGVEVPNVGKATLGLGSLLGTGEFSQSAYPLLVALGRDIAGTPHYANLAKMPHLLIAGATGSGKSVTIHTLITSLLYRNGPDALRLLMVDPKRVELTLYNSIPHLLAPVITDAKRAILALKWAAKEMDRRYNILEELRVRDISSYHANVVAPKRSQASARSISAQEGEELPEPMPHIVIIIDELADIMQAYPRELESAIVRLAQMSRAVGIHLMLSTQRPSVNVITGLIKANVPARLALQVASQIDSRTILDMAGAEKLLGAGDMLYLSGEMSKPRRLQAPFVSETELKKITTFLARKNERPDDVVEFTQESAGGGNLFASGALEEEDDDALYEEAREAVMKARKASTSYLQRKLRVGYARAARLIDLLEERGIIGPQDGSKPREVLAAAGDTSPNESDEEEAVR